MLEEIGSFKVKGLPYTKVFWKENRKYYDAYHKEHILINGIMEIKQ